MTFLGDFFFNPAPHSVIFFNLVAQIFLLENVNNICLNNRNVLSHSTGGVRCESKLSAASDPSEGSEGESVPCLSPSFWWFVGFL